ncbi:MAG: DUF21 domain-containing protein, partial [Bacteroidales bacterium]|nr:DUF21 domain-containing protein [Bacteroidales bacterium]
MVTWIIIVLALVLSAFFSGMEIAFVTSNKLKLEIAIKKDSFNSKVLALITKNSSQYISTMLVGNNLANVIYTIFLAKLLAAPLAPLNNELLILLLQT